MTSAVCSPTADSAFGPAVNGCRQDFDFTLAFEQYFFSIVPSVLLLLLAPLRLKTLVRVRPKIRGSNFKFIKLSVIIMLGIFQVTLIILCATNPQSQAWKPLLAASVLSLASSIAMCTLSYMEHSRSLRPSLLLNGYLFVTVLLDTATLRTLWLLSSFPSNIRGLLTAAFVTKAIVLVLEARGKWIYSSLESRRKSPEQFSGLYQQAFLSWLNRLVWQGANHLLKPDDLYPVNDDIASGQLSARYTQEYDRQSKTSPANLNKVIFLLLKWPMLIPVIPRLVLLALTFCQPLLLKRLLQYLEYSDTDDMNIGYGLIGAYLIVYLGIAVTSAIYWHRHYRFLSMLRGTLVTAVYSKAVSLSAANKDNKASITLMSTDVERTVRGLIDLHEMWANVIQVAIATWLIEIELGAACIGPVVVALAATGTTIWFSKYTTSFQLQWIKKVEERIGITTSILGAMKAIKLTGLGSQVSSLLIQCRVNELAAARRFRNLTSISVAIGNIPQLVAPVLTLAIYIGISSKLHTALDTTRLFTSLSLILLASEPLFMLINGIMEMTAAVGCFKRIQAFLLSSSRSDYRSFATTYPDDTHTGSEAISSHDAVLMRNASFGWNKDDPFTVRNINLRIPRSSLVMIAGPVACGKSTLLKGFLGETSTSEGRIELSSSNIAFCEQTAWLMNASVQRNIIMFSDFDLDLYTSVIHACDLGSDLEALPSGDLTVVGSKGFALSGGQKQRIALARAVYSRCPIVILDDTFGQLDLSTQVKIFDRLLGSQGLLRQWKSTTVMTTTSVKFFSKADDILMISPNGTIECRGTLESIRTAGSYAALYTTTDETDTAQIDQTEALDDRGVGNDTQVYAAETSSSNTGNASGSARQQGDSSIYSYYFVCLTRTVAAIFLLLQLSYAFLSIFPTIWLKWWAESNDVSKPRYGYYIGIYASLQAGALILSAAVTWWSFNVMAVKTGTKLYNILANTVMSAPLAFFASTDSGSILTRFSQDIQLLDMSLPLALMVVTTNVLTCLGQMALIASASAWIALSFPFLFVVFYLLQKFYLKTSRQMRLLDLEAKAPVYTQFVETLDGLATIRAFGWTQLSVERNHELVDHSQKPNYLMYAIQKWLALVLDLIITAIAVLIVGIVVGTRDSSGPGFTGVSLTQIISFASNVKLLIMFWTSMETSLGAVARIKQFEQENLAEDQPGETHDAPFDWPNQGAIEISNLSAKHKRDSERLTLDKISISIAAGSKVSFCGRTGCGKSSLLLTLFNLLTPQSGSIKIDGRDISSVRRESLRSRLICMAEEPYLLPKSVRENLGFDSMTVTDAEMMKVLQQTGLEDVIASHGGLDAMIDGVFLSQGQKQLLNIARALLKKKHGKVLIMDEATSSIDSQTDIDIQKLIRAEFASHTIMAVAHKLETITDFDFVGVLHEGRLVEYGNPQTLLLQRDSKFAELYNSRQG